MQTFYCNKRFDISFVDFHKMIKLILPSDYRTIETRGFYRQEYQPCNIIEIKQADETVANIYCWLGQKGLTVLADTELACSLCIEVLKNVKQNPEDYKVLSFDMISRKKLLIDNDELRKNYIMYEQINSSDNTHKYLIKEYNGDEVELAFYYEPDSIRLSGAVSSLFTYVQLLIETNLKSISENSD